MQNLLNQIYLIYDKYEYLSAELGRDFNIFSILNMERKEVETHSKFIYELLNPSGSHAQKQQFLALFLESALGLTEYGDILKVAREDWTAKSRRIDFTIETTKFHIAIEMKIDAKDQDEQLFAYHEELTHRQNPSQETQLYYLTLFGTDADEKSSRGIPYKNISFEADINQWLDECIKASSLKPTLREGINQYKKLIEKLTHQNGEIKMAIMENILQSEANFVASELIYNHYLDSASKIETEFWDKFNAKMYLTFGKHFEDDFTYNQKSNSQKIEHIKTLRQKTNTSSEFNTYIALASLGDTTLTAMLGTSNNDNYLYCTICAFDKEDQWVKDQNDQTIAEILQKHRFETYREWSYGFKIFDNEITLRGDAASLYKFSDKKFCETKIDALSVEIKKLIDQLKKDLQSYEKLTILE